jgi:endonuclease/exonuclease/phosphatase family metal-dependent hydrolase
MKKIRLRRNLGLLIFIVFLFECNLSAQPTINFMSWNLRLYNNWDGPNIWENRKEEVKGLILFYQADILCTQEGVLNQLVFLRDTVGGYDYIGVGRDDGKEKGEFSAIFYRKDRLEVTEQGTFWLSETPGVVSKGWDAAIVRVCTWGVFRDKKSKKQFMVFNTHFDHIGQVARENSARLIMAKMKELNTKNLPVMLAGDFNSTPDSKPYQVMAEVCIDARMVSEIPAYGPLATFNGFRFDQEPTERIDYIFIDGKTRVKRYAVLTNSQGQRYPSDHFPIFTELVIK